MSTPAAPTTSTSTRTNGWARPAATALLIGALLSVTACSRTTEVASAGSDHDPTAASPCHPTAAASSSSSDDPADHDDRAPDPRPTPRSVGTSVGADT